AAVVEVEFIAHDQTTSAGRLHVAPVPIARGFRRRDEGLALRPVPMPAVAAESDADFVGLRPARRNVQIATPDREQAEDQALVSHAVEIVKLRLDLQVIARQVEIVDAGPQRRLLIALPMRAGHQIGRLPVLTPPRGAGAVAEAVDPDLAERVVERRGT